MAIVTIALVLLSWNGKLVALGVVGGVFLLWFSQPSRGPTPTGTMADTRSSVRTTPLSDGATGSEYQDQTRNGDLTFEALRSALARDGSISGPTALAALLAGARWEIPSNTASASTLWAIWCDRLDMLVETGESDPGLLESLAQAVDGLHDVGDARVYMATVVDPPRRFHVYLTEDLARCVGAWEGRVNEQAPRTAT
ncbi:hypothetical protein [Streptomyces sp. NPDC058613]|uniref:hypothetical protein n=1 Tax=Streptomyces sp. NPDC058613 TaxID=3346556 RepID=UPI003647A361